MLNSRRGNRNQNIRQISGFLCQHMGPTIRFSSPNLQHLHSASHYEQNSFLLSFVSSPAVPGLSVGHVRLLTHFLVAQSRVQTHVKLGNLTKTEIARNSVVVVVVVRGFDGGRRSHDYLSETARCWNPFVIFC